MKNWIRNFTIWTSLAAILAIVGVGNLAGAQEAPRLDLNQASEEALLALPGIGPSKAEAIVAFRSRRPFTRVEDLLQVRGIGRGIFRSLRDLVIVSPQSRSNRAGTTAEEGQQTRTRRPQRARRDPEEVSRR